MCPQECGVRPLPADAPPPQRWGAPWEAEEMADNVRRLSRCLFYVVHSLLASSLRSLGRLPPHPFFSLSCSPLPSSPPQSLTPLLPCLLVPNPSLPPASPPPPSRGLKLSAHLLSLTSFSLCWSQSLSLLLSVSISLSVSVSL